MDAKETVRELRQTFKSGVTKPYAWRIAQIQAVCRLVKENESEIVESLAVDNGKPTLEAEISEIVNTLKEADAMIAGLRSWMAPEPAAPNALLVPCSAEIRREPFGVCLIMGPSNYPWMLVLKPLLGALAGGNCAVLKPSEMCEATAVSMKRLIGQYLDPSAVRVLEGGIAETQAMLKEKYDLIFFTGSERVGQIVARAAVEHLTPVILELGGKNCAIVDSNVQSLEVVAKRLVWGKCFNAGQSCVAPDYVLVLEDQAVRLKELMVKYVHKFYSEDPQKSGDFGRVKSKQAAMRVQKMVADGKGEILVGGQVDLEDRYVAPTIISEPILECSLMKEEIFAPVLCVFSVKSIDDAIAKHHAISGETPLSLYVFSSRSSVIEKCLSEIRSGGAVINDCLMGETQTDMPFGGVGSSGIPTP
ncbi:Aldehyde/histidinol dehydrogenase [Baffinella frigidus]|nr:Aldehyde/histidinol dehydrogenase [Cryptophyta sp. CCMP2293]